MKVTACTLSVVAQSDEMSIVILCNVDVLKYCGFTFAKLVVDSLEESSRFLATLRRFQVVRHSIENSVVFHTAQTAIEFCGCALRNLNLRL